MSLDSKFSGTVLALLLSRHDMNHDKWETVAWSRGMIAMAKDLAVPSAVTDINGRPIVDALPVLYLDADMVRRAPADISVCEETYTTIDLDAYASDDAPTMPRLRVA